MSAPRSAASDSPCTKVCQIAPGSGLCRGCQRTIDEIAGWATMSAADRAAVLADLPSRRQRMAASGEAVR